MYIITTILYIYIYKESSFGLQHGHWVNYPILCVRAFVLAENKANTDPFPQMFVSARTRKQKDDPKQFTGSLHFM